MRKLADELAVSIHTRSVAPLEGSVNQLTALAKSFSEQLRMAAERSRSEGSVLSAQPAGGTASLVDVTTSRCLTLPCNAEWGKPHFWDWRG